MRVGFDFEANADLYAELGARAGFKAGLGFELLPEFRNISGLDPPDLELLPGQPNGRAKGNFMLRPYLKANASLAGGIAIKVVSGTIRFDSEGYARLHAQAETEPIPCLQYGVDLGFKGTVGARLELLGFKIFDESVDVLRYEETDVLEGAVGCKGPPIVVLEYTKDPPIGLFTTYHLDASKSFDPDLDGGQLYFEWDTDGDGLCDVNSRSRPTLDLTRPPCTIAPGMETGPGCHRRVTIFVYDDEGERTKQTIVLR